MSRICLIVLGATVLAGSALAQEQRAPPTPARAINANFVDINRKILEMAKDFPEEKYEYRLTLIEQGDMRSFGAVIVHIASGNIYGAKAGRGEKANWDELDPKDYKGKAAIVAALQSRSTTPTRL